MSGAAVQLDTYVREKGPLPYAKAARVAQEVLAQIGILVSRGGGRALSGISLGRIVVSPNGQVVLLAPADELPVTVTAPAYASPEEIRGSSPDGRSAIYSLGCALFELLTGRPPFLGKDPRAVLKGHLSTPAPDLTALRPDIPEGLAAAVRSFLSKDRAQRPENPARAADLLRAALHGSAEGPPPSRGPLSAPAARPVTPPHARPVLGAGRRGPSRTASGLAQRRPGAPVSHSPAVVPPAPLSRHAPPSRRGREDQYSQGHPRRGGAGSWIFTWCGLGLGAFLSLLLISNAMLKKPPPPPPVSRALIQAQIEEAKAKVEKAGKVRLEEDRIASMEFDHLNPRLAYAERAAMVRGLLERYSHTPSARKMAENLDELRAMAEIAAQNPARDEIPQAEPVPATAPAPPPAEPSAPPKEPDGVGVEPAVDDGKTDL